MRFLLLAVLLLLGTAKAQADSETAIPYQIAISGKSTCAMTSKGVICWGEASKWSNLNEYPMNLTSPSEIIGFDWGGFCVVDRSQIKCWGNTEKLDALNIPTNLSHPHGLTILGENVCVIVDEGVRCWGTSDYIVKQIPNDLRNPKQVVIGAWDYACASTDDGIRCWGKRCGGFFCGDLDSIEALGKVEKLWSQGNMVYALKADGSLVTGGLVVDMLKPPEDVKTAVDMAISESGHTACALDDHRIRCWGNTGGYSGLNYNTILDEVKEFPLKGGHSLSISQDMHAHLCVLADTGIKCWGENDYSQAIPPKRLKDPKKIYVAHTGACVQNEHELSCWGGNGLSNRAHRPFYKTDLLYSVPASRILDFIFSNDTYFRPTCIILGNEVHCQSWSYGKNISIGNAPYGVWSGDGADITIPSRCFADRDGLRCRGEYGSLPNFTQNTPVISEKIKKTIFTGSYPQASSDSACAFSQKSAYCWSTGFVNKLDFHSVTDASKVFSSEAQDRWHICLIEDGAHIKCGRPGQKNWGEVQGLHLPKNITGAKYIAATNMDEICFGYSDHIDCWDTKLGQMKGHISTPNLQQVVMGHDSSSEWKDGAVCAIFDGRYDCWLTDGTRPNPTLPTYSDWGMLTNLSPYTIQQF